MTDSLYGNPFTTPNFTPGATFQDYYYNSNPELAYRNQLNQGGVNLYSNFGRFAQGQYGQQYQGYQADAPKHGLDYTFTNYLNDNGGFGNLQNQFRGLSPSQRGERPGSSVGRVRYVGF
jgi:hypothetical protein